MIMFRSFVYPRFKKCWDEAWCTFGADCPLKEALMWALAMI